jgi:hypothetical protein
MPLFPPVMSATFPANSKLFPILLSNSPLTYSSFGAA